MRRLKRRYAILKIKWFLLFILPLLLIAVSYQAAKQYLKLKIRQAGGHMEAQDERPGREPAKDGKPDGESKTMKATTNRQE